VTSAVNPYFLMVQLPAAVDSAAYLQGGAQLAAEYGGKVLANAPAAAVECLESGTPAAAMLLVEFEQQQSIDAFWSNDRHQAIFARLNATPEAVALSVAGLPYEGLPDALEIPTIASVTPPENRFPCAYMIVQGGGTDQARMDQYRDIILPMIKEQGAYYTAFEIEGNVNLLCGQWPHDIFAISRWPDHESGHAFWDSDRYQNTAIPVRTGVGHFLVHYLPGTVT
jgi:uncharacterized protein (DUF1330 family)